MLTKASMEPVLDFMLMKFKEKLAEQGHRLTGTLEKSLDYRIDETGFGVIGYVFAEEYGLTLETGLKPGQIKRDIPGMIRFFRLRGLSDKAAIRAEYLTYRAWRREGMPTRASGRFSKTGRRTGWISETLKDQEQAIANTTQTQVQKLIAASLLSGFTAEPVKLLI